ncbi:LVIVD repeat-containing protein [Halomarina litorea]|uniref:LVIVD repeat-containing protein n=1 Tax=Halomarina litorea TaxID=2961595 RepID=UPI0020C5A0B6|nr:hypothetical protein [Halomarina sp. BCD28]
MTGPTRRSFLAGVTAAGVGASLPTTARTGNWRQDAGEFAPLGTLELEGTEDADVSPDGETVYVAVGDGFAAVDVSTPGDPTLLAERRGIEADRETGPLTGIWDVQADGEFLLVVGPAGPAETELKGAALYDVRDPADPRQVSFFETDHDIHNAALAGTTAYLTGSGPDRAPVVVVEMEGTPEEVARWSLFDVDDRWAEVPQAARTCHDVMVRDGVVYASYWDAGTWVVDLSDPASPEFLARVGGRPFETLADIPENDGFESALTLPGNAHNAALNDDGTVLAVGREAFDVEGTGETATMGGVALWDVSDLGSAEHRTTIAPPELDRGGGVHLTTAHNCHFRGDRLYTSWYQGGVRVYDASDPTAPTRLASWADAGRASFFDALPVADGVAAPNLGVSPEQGGPPEGAGVYTFPEPEAGGEPATTRTPTGTPTPTANGTATSATPTGTTEPVVTTGAATTAPTSVADSPAATSADGPGFGPLAALAGGGLAAWRLLAGDAEK